MTRERDTGTMRNIYDLDQIEREYLDGASSYELGEKYGVNHTTISKWMRKRGIHLGKGAHQEGRKGTTKASGEFVYTERMREINQRKHEDGERRFAHRLAETQDGRFEYVGGFRDGGQLVATIRCTTCGHEFVHGITDMDKHWQCPKCNEAKRREQEQKREAQRYERMFSELREYAVAKTCAHCGGTFQSSNPNAKYCSKTCARKAHDARRIRVYRPSGHHHYYHVKYGERYLEHYDPSITLHKLYERDGGVCQICGEPCDWDDREWGGFGPTYPSIDHIVPRAQGGDHFWSNVQLAHCICNSHKRDLPNEIAREVVTQDVEIAS
jgi:5-methylcytosine-specific restriction endonuclease McrA